MRQKIEINIDELVLEGFEASDKYAIADALERELGNLLREQGLTPGVDPSAQLVDRLNAGSISLKDGARSASVGSQIGRAVFASLKTSTATVSSEKSSSAQEKTAAHSVKPAQRPA